MKSTVLALCVFALVPFVASCDDHDHPPGSDGHSHPPAGGAAPKAAEGGGHGHQMTALGESAAGPFRVVTERGAKAPKAGGDAPIDVVLKADAGAPAVVAVRAWIGTPDGKGALKLKLAVEDPAHPEHYHGHVDVPDPFEAAHRLHVEVEVAGAKHVASFDLKL
jgi:hypothetical protein